MDNIIENPTKRIEKRKNDEKEKNSYNKQSRIQSEPTFFVNSETSKMIMTAKKKMKWTLARIRSTMNVLETSVRLNTLIDIKKILT